MSVSPDIDFPVEELLLKMSFQGCLTLLVLELKVNYLILKLLLTTWLDSRATQSYVTITAHFINFDMELCSRVLQTRQLPESHTGKHVGNVLRKAQHEWSCKVNVLTTDNDANMKIAAQTAGIPIHIGCFAHTLNLASGRALDLKEIHHMLAKMRSIVSFMHCSTTAAAILKQKQKMLNIHENKLIIDVRTRWNSSYLMVERFLQQQVAILATLTDERIKKQIEVFCYITEASVQASNILGQDEVQRFEEFLKLMEPLYQATLALSAYQYPTVGLMFPLLQKLKDLYSPLESDSPFQTKIKNAILKDLEKRYQSEALMEYFEEASVLDPRVKDKVSQVAWDRLRDKVMNLPSNQYLHVKTEPGTYQAELPELPALPSVSNLPAPHEIQVKEESADSPTSTATSAKRKRSALSFLIDEDDDVEISKVEPPLSKEELVNKEMSLYNSDRKLSSHASPLKYWKENASRFPFLSRLVKIYLCAQASSVASERVFSTPGDIVTATRSCLDPEHVDQLIFLKKNFDQNKDMAAVLHNM
ncbi:E3 SUMO-protein ligase ZBED1-like [Argopecten irradians]|uniref:E3 SUMO-protein ligase ZBED1-like n=1 Tax=Argopecten irradians TaxID=31199 RepID=UPI003716BFA5